MSVPRTRVSISSPSSEGGEKTYPPLELANLLFPLVLLQAKAVSIDDLALSSPSIEVSISSPSSEGGEIPLYHHIG